MFLFSRFSVVDGFLNKPGALGKGIGLLEIILFQIKKFKLAFPVLTTSLR